MKPLLIVSIFAPSDLNQKWYSLQKRFIAKTTRISYDYRIILNGADTTVFDSKDILLNNGDNLGHSHALMQVVNYFRENPYDAYLILDSDCFPVWEGWHDVLLEQMQKFGKRFAAPVRAENLDAFPHPSAFFATAEGIRHPGLDFARHESVNLLGDKVVEVGGAMQAMNEHFLPLVRTNTLNVHPVAAGIYHHLFYHHGAGSRDFNFRILKRYDYYQHWFDNENREAQCRDLLNALMQDPDGFIQRLMHEQPRKCFWK